MTRQTDRQTEDSEDEYDQMENERLRDLEERDAFAGRLKTKDKEKTRQIVSKTEKKVGLPLGTMMCSGVFF